MRHRYFFGTCTCTQLTHTQVPTLVWKPVMCTNCESIYKRSVGPQLHHPVSNLHTPLIVPLLLLLYSQSLSLTGQMSRAPWPSALVRVGIVTTSSSRQTGKMTMTVFPGADGFCKYVQLLSTCPWKSCFPPSSGIFVMKWSLDSYYMNMTNNSK